MGAAKPRRRTCPRVQPDPDRDLHVGHAEIRRCALRTTPIYRLWYLTVAVRGTEGALLGNVGEGWAELLSFENTVGGCVDQNLLWHLELQGWPDEEAQQQLAFAVGDRLEDAWGVSQRRYLAHRGDRAGRLDLRRIST